MNRQHFKPGIVVTRRAGSIRVDATTHLHDHPAFRRLENTNDNPAEERVFCCEVSDVACLARELEYAITALDLCDKEPRDNSHE